MGSCWRLCVFTPVTFILIVLCQISISMVSGSSPPPGGNLRVIIPASQEQCFYQELTGQDNNIWIDYAVVGSTQAGGMNIDFQLLDPDSRPLLSEFNKALSNTHVTVKLPGVYKFCFDNSQSRFNEKTVAFIMTTKNASAANWGAYSKQDLAEEGVYDIKVNEIKTRMDRVRTYINEIQLSQDNFRLLEARDRSTVESNFERVNFWSALFIAATLIVLGLQTFTVRMFFEDKSHMVHKFVRDLRRGVKK